MAGGIKTAGFGLGLLVTAAGLVGLSLVLPIPERSTPQAIAPLATDAVADDLIKSPEPVAPQGHNDSQGPEDIGTLDVSPDLDTPEMSPLDEVDRSEAETTPELVVTEETSAETDPVVENDLAAEEPEIDAPIAPELPAPNVVTGMSEPDTRPLAASPTETDAARLGLREQPAVRAEQVPQAPFQSAALAPDTLPFSGGMPPAPPLSDAMDDETLTTPDVPQPLDVPEAELAEPASDTPLAPVISALPGRAIGALPGQPARRPNGEPPISLDDMPADRPALTERDDSALARNAIPFATEPGRPLMALVLSDPGLPRAEREALAARPLPFTVALNPLDPSAPEAAEIFRAAGKEVFILAAGIPTGATISDVEVTLGAYFATLPQAAGLIDLPRDGFMRNARLMGDVLQVVSRDGHGLITFAGGLGQASRAAAAAGIAHAEVFRVLDANNESPFTIRRFLDRAVFQATQMGHVIVYGEASNPELLSAMDMWVIEGRRDQVATVPVSAILLAPR